MGKKKIAFVVSQKRELWADAIRVVAIYLVVQLHLLPTNAGIVSLFLSKISVICVPLFVMLSGALLIGKEESYQTFFLKRSLKVLVPWVVWTIIYMYYYFVIFEQKQTLAAFFSNPHHSPFLQWGHFFLRTFFSNLWFLPLIFCLYLLTPLFRILIRNTTITDNYYIFFLWFSSLSLAPFLFTSQLFPTWEPDLFFTTLQYSGYFILGYVLLYRLPVIKKINNIWILLCIGLLPIVISFIPLASQYTQKLISNFLSPGTIISSIAFFLLIFKLSNKIEKKVPKNVKEVTAYVSGAALGIYIIHSLVSAALTLFIPLYLYRNDFTLILTFVIFWVSFVVVFILQRIPVVKYIVP